LRKGEVADTVETMNDTSARNPQATPNPDEWLLLIHQIPPEPGYFRVKVRRRLQRLGAVALKNSVYVLPRSDDTLEDFQWLAQEIRADGGEATLIQALLLDGITDEEVRALFRADRDADYAEIAHAAAQDAADPERLRRRLDEVSKIDFFGAPGRAQAEGSVRASEVSADSAPAPASDHPRGAMWVTRDGVFVDRIASAWLIRRFIDPKARFKFVPARGYRPEPGERRFDMYQGEYSHEGDRCTFEVLLARFGLGDPALAAIGEIVHDLDCKDAKFGRPEAAGFGSIVGGIALAHPADGDRLAQGAAVLDGLYAQLRAGG